MCNFRHELATHICRVIWSMDVEQEKQSCVMSRWSYSMHRMSSDALQFTSDFEPHT